MDKGSIFYLDKHPTTPVFRMDITPVANITDKEIEKNRKYTFKRKFKEPRWGVATKGICAVVGGGVSVKNHLDRLRKFDGDIYAINDAAKYLSDNGIKCYMYAIDGSKVPFKKGKNVKGALFCRRVHRVQFERFRKKDTLVFDLLEDHEDGIEGGGSALCRAPHLFIKMGYVGIDFYGAEGSFLHESHNTGDHADANSTKMIITVDGVDYITSCAFLLQNQYMAPIIGNPQLSKYFKSFSGGLLDAMAKHPKTWSVSAVCNGVKAQTAHQGNNFPEPYQSDRPLWHP